MKQAIDTMPWFWPLAHRDGFLKEIYGSQYGNELLEGVKDVYVSAIFKVKEQIDFLFPHRFAGAAHKHGCVQL